MPRIPAGRRFYGVDIGVVLLDNDLPRPRGDLGNATSYAYPVAYDTCEGADTVRVVEREAEGLLDAVTRSVRRLAAAGVRAVATCCGFLAIFQREMTERAGVPVATSSLLQVPLVLRVLAPEQRVCLLTVNASTLTDRHLDGAGIGQADRDRVSVVGLEGTAHFYPMIVGAERSLDVERAEAEVVAMARAAVEADPTIGAFVFECTNLPPYAAAVRAATDRPVWDALSLVDWLRYGVHVEEGTRS